jgi:hypothetical protein
MEQNLPTAVPLHWPQPEAARTATTCATTTPTSGQPPRSAWPTAHIKKTNRPAVATQTATAGLITPAVSPASASVMSLKPAKNLIFLHGSHNDFRFLADSGASMSILPTGPYLVGANSRTIPAWGFREFSVCFLGPIFKFVVGRHGYGTPLPGMNFLTNFGLSIIPTKQQVLHKASSRIFSKASIASFIAPWNTETAMS